MPDGLRPEHDGDRNSMQIHRQIATGFRQLLLLGGLFHFSGCSQDGQPSDTTIGDGAYADITGSITNESGVGSSMSGWFLALIDKDTKETRVASIGASGGYKFTHVFTSKTYTIQLLSPSSVFRASLGYPDDNDATRLHPYFTLNGLEIPPLVSKGSGITMSSTDGITLTTDTIVDNNKDGVADVIKNVWGPKFDTYVEWFVAKVSSELQLDGTSKSYVTFYTKLRDNQGTPLTVQVIGASSLASRRTEPQPVGNRLTRSPLPAFRTVNSAHLADHVDQRRFAGLHHLHRLAQRLDQILRLGDRPGAPAAVVARQTGEVDVGLFDADADGLVFHRAAALDSDALLMLFVVEVRSIAAHDTEQGNLMMHCGPDRTHGE